MSLKKYQEDFIQFVEAGFIAINQGAEKDAVNLFSAAEKLNTKNTLPQIGRAYLFLHKLELKKAGEILEKILQKEPENEVAFSLLGIVKMMTPNETLKGEAILSKLSKSEDKDIKKLSELGLDFSERFIRKAPTPLEVKKKR